MKPSIVYLYLILFCYGHSSYTQNSDYIATDSTLDSRVKLLEGLPQQNSQFILAVRQGKEIKYTPEDISEYGFKNGTVYVAKKVTLDGAERNVFLQRLEQGTISLYRYNSKSYKTYFIEKEPSTLEELKNDMESFSRLSKDCLHINDAIKLSSYNKNSLIKLTNHYNECKPKPFPHKKLGILVGIEKRDLEQSSTLDTLISGVSFNSSTSTLIGIYIDLPIEMTNFSIVGGVYFSKTGFSGNIRRNSNDVDVLIDLTSARFPLLLQYALPISKWRPYINIGGSYSYNFRKSSSIFQSTFVDDLIVIDEFSGTTLVSETMNGYLVGCGFQYDLNERQKISSEIRFGKSFGSSNTLDQRIMSLLLNFSF